MIVGIDGYIFDVLDFFLQNDVVLIKYLLFINDSVKIWFQENDNFMVDRGFLEEEEFNEIQFKVD